jgi:pimeloyl-ACP methyl ester carboxylesterase
METQSTPTLHVEQWGSGPGVVMVHGGDPGGGASAFALQRPLAERWTLILPDRPGHGQTPPAGHEDFARDGALVAPLLGEGAHLVGHSYGGLVALVAAAARPDAVRSLTLIEPGAFGVAPPDDPAVKPMREAMAAVRNEQDPRRRLVLFWATVGNPTPVPDPLPPAMARFADDLLAIRQPAPGTLPLDEVAAAGFPVLLISGEHSAGFERICDLLAARLHGQRAIIPGQGHLPQRTGKPFNNRLENFLRSAEVSFAGT